MIHLLLKDPDEPSDKELIADLSEQGILVKADSLKTGQILDAYIP